MKLLPLLVASALALVAVAPVAQASTLIGGAWDAPFTFPQDQDEPIVKSGRTDQPG